MIKELRNGLCKVRGEMKERENEVNVHTKSRELGSERIKGTSFVRDHPPSTE